MKLIGALASPYVRKTRIVMAEKKIDYEFILDNPWDAATKVPAFNPLGKIPALVMDDGGAVFDSRVIVEYLDTVNPVNKLIPASGRARVEVRCWEALADGICDAAIVARLEGQREKKLQSADWIKRHLGKVDQGRQHRARKVHMLHRRDQIGQQDQQRRTSDRKRGDQSREGDPEGDSQEASDDESGTKEALIEPVCGEETQRTICECNVAAPLPMHPRRMGQDVVPRWVESNCGHRVHPGRHQQQQIPG